jgi:hypothetical protein
MVEPHATPEEVPNISPARKARLGIYVISGGCFLTTWIAAANFAESSGLLKLFDGFIALLAFVLGIGLFLRLRLARVLLLFALGCSFLLEAFSFALDWSGGESIRFGRLFIRIGLAVWAAVYLLRSDVALAFRTKNISGANSTRSRMLSFTPVNPALPKSVTGGLIGMILGFLLFIVLMLFGVLTAVSYNATNSIFCALLVVGSLAGMIAKSR